MASERPTQVAPPTPSSARARTAPPRFNGLDCRRGQELRHIEVKGVCGTAPCFLLTEGERSRAETDPLWRVAIVTDALGPSPSLMEVSGAELLSGWRLDPVTWRVSPG